MRHSVSGGSCVLALRDTGPVSVGSVQLTWPGKQAQARKQGNSVARLRASDHDAVEEFFNACYPRLAGWVRRLVDDDDTAHEIASEAFTRLLSRWSGLDNPQRYVYMIATNLVRDHWRKRGRRTRDVLSASPGRRRARTHRAAPRPAAQRFPAALLRRLRGQGSGGHAGPPPGDPHGGPVSSP